MPSFLRVDTAVRCAALLLCTVLGVASDARGEPELVVFLLALTALTAVSAAVRSSATSQRLAGVVEGAVWAGAVLTTGGSSSPLLPYLLAPAFVGGLTLGLEGVVVPVGIAGVSLLSAAGSVDPDRASDVLTASAEWVGIALLVGLLASWVRRLTLQREAPEDEYAAAYRLVGQLRNVARHLSVGLDKVALADAMLRSLRTQGLAVRSGAVLARTAGERVAVLATTGADRLDWVLDLTRDSALSEAWAAQTAQTRHGSLSGGGAGCCVALPLLVGLRTIGMVGIELDSAPPSAELLADLQQGVGESALALETALLFDELREVATVEERRRLAREIHDGVAQDLAGVGYLLDDLVQEAQTAGAEAARLVEPLVGLRTELGRVVAELRSSLFELRTEVDQHGGLGAALSEHVRSVGTTTAMTVHLTLDESPLRLPADTEAELLRIAQEAIANARKHARADNLWVSCTIDPPRACLEVADDGVGLSGGVADDRFGLEIMRERAARLRADLSVSPRRPRGTVVVCRVGPQSTGNAGAEVLVGDDRPAGR